MGDAILTHHAKKRAKQRLGINKRSSQKQADKALEFGLLNNEFSGSFRRYLDGLYFKYETAGAVRVYGEHVYLFNTEDVLITIMHVPTKYKRLARKLGGRKNGI